MLLLITSGIPGFYTYYALSSKNIIYFNTDNKNIILGFFSIISILIFLLILSLFSGINNVNDLFENLIFTKIILALIVSIIIVVILSEAVYPTLLNFYNYFNNNERARTGLNNTEALPIHLSRYENSNYKIYVVIKSFSNDFIEKGFIDEYSRKDNQNLLLDPRFNNESESIIKIADKTEIYIDFENGIKLDYHFISKSKIT